MAEPVPDLSPTLKSPLWRLLARNRLTRVVRASRYVANPLRFCRAELLHRDEAVRMWRIRGTGDRIALRTGTPDFDVFEEIFRARTYQPVPEVRAALDGLGRPLVVADIGANIGLFALWALSEFPVGHMRMVEPNPRSLELLEAAVAASPRPESMFTMRAAAAGTSPGTSPFRTGDFQMSRTRRSDEPDAADVIDVQVLDVLPLISDADLLKLDIEGAEWPILADSRLADTAIRALVVEYHEADGSPGEDLPEAAAGLLEAQGFSVRHLFWNPPYVGQLWAWR